VYETDDRYVVTAELPGLARDDIELALDTARMTIRGTRADSPARGGEIVHFHQVERGHGAFSRTFEFAERIAVSAVTADLTSGVLTVTLPKAPPEAPRKIEVQ